MQRSHRTASPALMAIVVSALAIATMPRGVRAQETCDRDGGTGLPGDYGALLEYFPHQFAMGVPLDGFVRLRYRLRAPTPPVVITHEGTMDGVVVPGRAVVVGAEIQWMSNAPLNPNTTYVVQFPNIASLAGSDTLSFTTGTATTAGMPLAFPAAYTSDALSPGAVAQRNGRSDECGDPNAVTVTLTFPRAQSTGGWPEGDLEYVVYETRGPGISGPVERARQRGRATTGTCPSGADYCPSFRLTPVNASEHICVNVQIADPYGNTDGNTREQCFDPSPGNFFNGCSVASVSARSSGRTQTFPVVSLAVLLVAIVSRRRSRRALLATVRVR